MGDEYHVEERDASITAVTPNFAGKDMVTADGRRYREHPNPALTGWKWVTNDTEGKSILMEGNMYIHPDAWGKVNALFGKSMIREWEFPPQYPVIGGMRPGLLALRMSGGVKGFMLVGPFHELNVIGRMASYGINPFNLPPIDPDDPVLSELLDYGLFLYGGNAHMQFSDGLAASGHNFIWKHVPLVGRALTAYQEHLFQEKIPELKALAAKVLFMRDLKRLAGKYTRKEIGQNAVRMVNNMFGLQNYAYLGRSPTIRDLCTILTLAPNFWESNLKLYAGALRPMGWQQLRALIIGGVFMAITAQVINALVGDKDRPPWYQAPFSVFIGGREWGFRSPLTDFQHMITDPRGYAYWRLNPLWGGPIINFFSRTDPYGKKLSMTGWAADILERDVPIPAGGFVKSNRSQTTFENILVGFLQSTGVTSKRAMSSFEKYAQNLQGPTFTPTRRSQLRNEFIDKVKQGQKGVSAEILKAIQEHKLAPADYKTIYKRAAENPAVTAARNITDIDQLADAIEKEATTKEKKALYPLFFTRVFKARQNGQLTTGQIARFDKILDHMLGGGKATVPQMDEEAAKEES